MEYSEFFKTDCEHFKRVLGKPQRWLPQAIGGPVDSGTGVSMRPHCTEKDFEDPPESGGSPCAGCNTYVPCGGTPYSRANQIRDFVRRTYIDPARDRGEQRVTIRTGDVHGHMGLANPSLTLIARIRA